MLLTQTVMLGNTVTNGQKSAVHDAKVGTSTVCVLGGRIDLPGLTWHSDPALPCAAVFLVGKVNEAELKAAIERMPDPAAPIADFAENHGARRDFVANVLNVQSIAAAWVRFAPIMQRLDEMPFQAPREERAEMLALRLAFSRDSPIEARLTSVSSHAIEYPLLGSLLPQRVELERLAFLDLLRRRHFMRTHACDRCTSNRLLAFEACHACGSSDLADEAIVHHYRCGSQEPESEFIQGNALICPKCHRRLQHFGMDYDKPGVIVHCRGCGASSPEPEPRFACMDCTVIIDGQRARTMDWFHYDLTSVGMQAQRMGRLPGDVGRIRVDGANSSRSLREFRLLATAALRSARRFSRPFTLARLSPVSLAALHEKHTVAAVEHALQQASTIVAEALTECEFVAVSDSALLIGFPEIETADAALLITRAQTAMTSAMEFQLDLQVTFCEGNEALDLLSHY